VAVDAVEKVRLQIYIRFRNDKNRPSAVVGITVTALPQFEESLVVERELGQSNTLESERTACIVQHTVEGCVLAVVSFNVVVLAAPAQLHAVKHSCGDNHVITFDVRQLPPSDGYGIAAGVEFAAVHLFSFGQLHLALSITPKTHQQPWETSIVGKRRDVARSDAATTVVTVPPSLKRLYVEFHLVAVDGASVASETIHLCSVEFDIGAPKWGGSTVTLTPVAIKYGGNGDDAVFIDKDIINRIARDVIPFGIGCGLVLSGQRLAIGYKVLVETANFYLHILGIDSLTVVVHLVYKVVVGA